MTDGTSIEMTVGQDAGAGVAAAAGYVHADGAFAEGWHGRPEFAEYQGMERFRSVPDLVKSYKALEQTLGKRAAQGTMVPGADAGEEQIAEYRKAIGIPDLPAGYRLRPEALPEGLSWDEGRAARMAETFHTHNVTPGAAQAIVDDFMQGELLNHKQAKAAFDQMMTSREEGLREEWGTGYEKKIGEIRKVVTAMGFDPGDAELFGNAKVLGFLGKVTGMLSEDAVSGMKGTVGSVSHFASGADEARAIARDVNHPEHARYMAGDAEVTAKVLRLYGS